MQILIISAGIIALITGITLWIAPKSLIRVGDFLNRVIIEELPGNNTRRKIMGIILILLGSLTIYSLIWI